MITGLFRDLRSIRRRTKRQRGILRRATRILEESKVFQFAHPFDAEFWSNYDHEHLDWDGIGDFGPRIRLITLEAHANLFKAYSIQCERLDKPFQLFISLMPADAGQDAVYIQTPNPHSEFPIDFSLVQWGIPQLESLFSRFLPEYEFVAGRGRNNLIIWAKGVGMPLDAHKSPNHSMHSDDAATRHRR